MIDRNPIFIDAIDPPGSIYKQAVAGNGELFLAVWSEVQGPTAGDIYGTRITTDGTLLDSTGFLIVDNKELYDVTFDGVDFLVHTLQSSSEIAVTSVKSTGAVGQTTLIATPFAMLDLPATAVLKEGKSCIAYSGWVDSLNSRPANTWRIHGRLFESGINAIDHPNTLKYPGGITVFSDPAQQTLTITGNPHIISQPKPGLRLSFNLYNSKGQNLIKHTSVSMENTGTSLFKRFHIPSLAGGRLPGGVYFVTVTIDKAISFKRIFLF